ncbi:hypothetical protein QAD02_008950 [Eretmocerus hayati]|uniref:Uncharacterized protein n=1 Tax=Eretmocerus hayati TaxID=131215 RepID=A0ACC2N8N1_9HYME|nr:hypothetical protein QAD02_008950 [Eretmocerus hayati]
MDRKWGECHKHFCLCRWEVFFDLVKANVITQGYLDKLEKSEKKRVEKEQKKLAKETKRQGPSARMSVDVQPSCSNSQPEPPQCEPDDTDEPSCSNWQPQNHEASE